MANDAWSIVLEGILDRLPVIDKLYAVDDIVTSSDGLIVRVQRVSLVSDYYVITGRVLGGSRNKHVGRTVKCEVGRGTNPTNTSWLVRVAPQVTDCLKAPPTFDIPSTLNEKESYENVDC